MTARTFKLDFLHSAPGLEANDINSTWNISIPACRHLPVQASICRAGTKSIIEADSICSPKISNSTTTAFLSSATDLLFTFHERLATPCNLNLHMTQSDNP
ncbi:hypothetical protein TWF751_000002 [Orbilia oligospora]|nr:hypothetical protein TWF751_000002 [Orbilia oligospora]